MDLYESIGYGHMSLGELTALVQDNLYRADQYGMKLHWHFEGTAIRGVVLEGGAVRFDKQYKGKFVHIHYAEMHSDWHEFFTAEVRRRKHAARKAQEEADREGQDLDKMTMGARIAFIKKLSGEDETSQVPVEED